MKKSCKNFLHEKFAKDRNTLIKQSFTNRMTKGLNFFERTSYSRKELLMLLLKTMQLMCTEQYLIM